MLANGRVLATLMVKNFISLGLQENKNSFGKAMLTHSDFARLTCQKLPQVMHRELHWPERLEKTRCLIWRNSLQSFIVTTHKISPQSGWCWQGQYHVGWATRGVALSALEQPRRRQIHHRIIVRGLCSRRYVLPCVVPSKPLHAGVKPLFSLRSSHSRQPRMCCMCNYR